MTCQLYVINMMPVLPLVLQFDLAQFLIKKMASRSSGKTSPPSVWRAPWLVRTAKKSAFTSKDEMGSGGKQTLTVPGGVGDAQMMLSSTCHGQWLHVLPLQKAGPQVRNHSCCPETQGKVPLRDPMLREDREHREQRPWLLPHCRCDLWLDTFPLSTLLNFLE